MKLKEEFKVDKEVFTKATEKTLYKLANAGYLDVLEGVISTGKEANVFRGKCRGKYVAVKIYRIETLEFNKLIHYLRGDPRFVVRETKRQMVYTWTRKEYKNLILAREAGVRVPEPIACRNNVLIMEFIGSEDGVPALPAKYMKPEDPEKWYKEILDSIKKLYRRRFVHGDISEYNVLNLNEEPVIIDISQGVVLDHPMAEEMLRRDIKNVLRWFKSLGVKTEDFDSVYRWIKNV